MADERKYRIDDFSVAPSSFPRGRGLDGCASRLLCLYIEFQVHHFSDRSLLYFCRHGCRFVALDDRRRRRRRW